MKFVYYVFFRFVVFLEGEENNDAGVLMTSRPNVDIEPGNEELENRE